MSDSLWPHGLQHARPPCPSPTPTACSNLCPLSRWCRPTIWTSVIPFSYLQSFPSSGSFPMSQFFPSVGQNTVVSASASVLPVFRTDFLYDWLAWSLFSPRDFQDSSPTPQFRSISSLVFSFSYSPTLTSVHDYWKTMALTRRTFVGKPTWVLILLEFDWFRLRINGKYFTHPQLVKMFYTIYLIFFFKERIGKLYSSQIWGC